MDDAAALAAIHHDTFDEAWDEQSFTTFLSDPTILAIIVRRLGRSKKPLGFVLARLVHDEAEIISIGVKPRYRRKQIAYRLMDALLRHLHHQRARTVYLEVAENNCAARALYTKFGFWEFGRRRGYYHVKGTPTDALMLRRDLNSEGMKKS